MNRRNRAGISGNSQINNMEANGSPTISGMAGSGMVGSGGRRGMLRRLLEAISGGRNDGPVRGRLLLEPLESRQMMAGDVGFLSTDGGNSSVDNNFNPGLFSTNGMVAEGEAANDLVAFAKALDQAGVTFFGAAWCPACTTQKELFQDGARFLPFVEVTNPDRSLNAIGQAEDITVFPTWDFPDGQRQERLLTLAQLSEFSGIAIPQSDQPTFAPIGNVTLEVGSPLHLAIDAYDPDDSSLTVTVTVADPSLLQANVLQNNRGARITVEGWGDMVFELFEDKAPRPTGRFIELAQSGFYNKTDSGEIIFHRVIDDFVLQAGDPTGTGSGGSTLGDFDDQFSPDLQHNRTGILSYAKSLDDTNDSQFFITEGQQRHLDYNHSIFGQLIEGDAVREAISETQLSNSRPTTPVVISNVEIFQDTENALVMLKATGTRLGQTDVTITVTDAGGHSYSEVITVTVVADQDNARPFLADIAPVTTAAGTPVVIPLQGIDVEGDPIVYEARVLSGAGATATVNQQTAEVTVTPAVGFSGQVLIEVAARNSSTPTSTSPTVRSSTMDIQEVAVNIGPSSPSSPSSPSAVRLIAASDTGVSNSDGITNTAPVTFTVTGVQPGASVEILAGDTQIGIGTATATTATITTNNFAALGNATHSVTARQTVNGVVSPRSPAITVTYDTVAPATVAGIPSQASVDVPYVANLQSDEEGNGLRYALVSGPAGATIAAETGLINWTPTTAQAGDQTIVVRMTDAAGNSSEQTFTVNVGAEPLLTIRLLTTDLNNNPITQISPGQEFKVRVFGFDERLFGEAQGPFAVYMDMFFDPALAEAVATDTFEYSSIYNSGVSGTIGTGVIEEVGSFASSNNFLGPGEQFMFSVRMRALSGGSLTITSDPAEGSGREIALFDIDDPIPNNRVVFGSTTLQVNSTFTAVNDTATVAEDSSATSIPVLTNDTLLVAGTVLSIASAQTSSSQGGTVSVSGSNVLYTPAANFNGTDTFTYTAGDQNGNQQTATVTVNVTAVNDPPTATNDAFNAAAGSTENLINVLANDSIAPDTGENLRVTALGVPSAGGTVTIGPNGANVRYTPRTGFVGNETFTYTVSDGSLTSTATVTVNVGGPTVTNDAFTIVEDAAVAEFNVLVNDSAANANVTLAISAVGSPANGTASVSSAGQRISYRPNPNFFGTDTVTYTVTDSNGATGTGTVTFSVTGVNDPPSAPNLTTDIVRESGQTEVLNVQRLRDLNIDGTGEALTITAIGTTSAGGTAQIASGGQSILYTASSATFTGTDTLTYTVTDASDLTATGTLTIDVLDYTPLDYQVLVTSPGSTSFSGATSARLTGTDFRGQAVQIEQAFNPAAGGFVFADQPPGNYQVEIPSMPFLYNGDQMAGASFSTDINTTIVDPVRISVGNLHDRYLSVRDFVNSSMKSYAFAAIRPGQTQAWMAATSNANTLGNIALSLSADGNTMTMSVDNPAASGGRLTAQLPMNNRTLVDERASVDGYRIFKINADRTNTVLAGLLGITGSTNTGTNSGTGTGTGSGEGEFVAISQTLAASSPTRVSDNASPDDAISGFAASGQVGEGESSAGPMSGSLVDVTDRGSIQDSSVPGSPSLGESRVSSHAAAIDSAMLDLLPQLELRSATAESLAEPDDEGQIAAIDAMLTALTNRLG